MSKLPAGPVEDSEGALHLETIDFSLRKRASAKRVRRISRRDSGCTGLCHCFGVRYTELATIDFRWREQTVSLHSSPSSHRNAFAWQ
jgi:hypothetical protein